MSSKQYTIFQDLEGLDWMDDKTRARAIGKLSEMKELVAYPDELLNQEKVDDFHRGLEVTGEDYLLDRLRLNNWIDKYKIDQLRLEVDPNDWTKHHTVRR